MPFFKKTQTEPASRNPAAKHNARLRARQQEARPKVAPARPAEPLAPSADSLPEAPDESSQATPGQKLRTILQAGEQTPPLRIPWFYRLRARGERVRRAAWDMAAILSLTLNAILLGVVILLFLQLQQIKQTVNQTVNSLMGGLYDNFVRMDNSVISTTIVIEDLTIPIDFILPVVQDEIYVTLTRDVTIRNAKVGILSLPTTVTLPAGTRLPISLGMEVPVRTQVSVDLQVPVNIQLSQAIPADPNVPNLHQAFLGLQNTIGPFYCLLNPEAQDYTGAYLCQQGVYIQRTP